MKTPLEKALSYTFSDPALARLALTHRSADRINNERLEFLGDAILGFVVADELLQRNPQASEGDLSRQRSALVNRQTLADLATGLGLGALLILGPGELKSGGRQRQSILADAVEAVVGAVYIDGGMDACRGVVLALYAHLLSSQPATQMAKDPKTQLQEVLQARGEELPLYQVVSIDGEEHQQTFVVTCGVSLLAAPTSGKGSSRRVAEQNAASKALRLLGL